MPSSVIFTEQLRILPNDALDLLERVVWIQWWPAVLEQLAEVAGSMGQSMF